MSIQGFQGVAYTQQGNSYQKSRAGKVTGAAVGSAIGTAAVVVPFVKTEGSVKEGVKAVCKISKNFIKRGENLGTIFSNGLALEGIKTPKIVQKALDFVTKTKVGRIATLAGVVSLPILTAMGLGKLIGHGVDKAVEAHRKHQADKLA